MQTLGHDPDSASMERSVDYLEVAVMLTGLRRKQKREDILHVGLIQLTAHGLDTAGISSGDELHLGRIRDLRNFGNDILVHGGSDLCAVTPEHLVAIVLLRVVGRRDHDSGRSLLVADSVAKKGHRMDLAVEVDMDAVCGKHVSRDLREVMAVVAAVVGNAHAELPADIFLHVVRKSLGRHSDRVLVHPVGSHAHHTAKSAGTELQVAVESVLKSLGVFRQFPDCGLGLLVEISVEPALGPGSIILFHNQCIFLGFNSSGT